MQTLLEHYVERYRIWRIVLVLMIAVVTLFALTQLSTRPADAQVFMTTDDKRFAASGGNCQLKFEVDCKEDSVRVAVTDVMDPSDFNNDAVKLVPRVFTATICRVEKLVGTLFADVWCDISKAMERPLALILILYISIFGISFTIGAVPFTIGEVFTRVMKLFLVWVFVTQAEWGLELAFNFFMFVMQDGIAIVLSDPPAEYPGQATSFGIISKIDEFAGTLFNFNQHDLLGRAVGIIGGFILMQAVPGGQVLGWMLIGTAFMTFFVFVRTILTYIVALVGVVFLLTLGPIFICFALFQPTASIFEQWLSQIVSLTLQPIIIFAYLMLAVVYIDNIWETLFNPAKLLNFTGLNYFGMNNIVGNIVSVVGNVASYVPPGCEIYDPGDCIGAINPIYGMILDSDFLRQIVLGLVALAILNGATLVFMDMVPGLARELVRMGKRSIQIGGAWATGTNVSNASGGVVTMAGENALGGFRQGMESYLDQNNTMNRPAIGELMNAGLGGAQKVLLGDMQNKNKAEE